MREHIGRGVLGLLVLAGLSCAPGPEVGTARDGGGADAGEGADGGGLPGDGVRFVLSERPAVCDHVLARSWTAAAGVTDLVVSLGADVDGDGLGEVLIGAPEATGGAARLYSGATGELLREWLAPEGAQSFGARVSLGPDVDGDGAADVLIGAPKSNGGAGLALLYSGATGARLQSFPGVDPGGEQGWAVSLGPDADGDGAGDVLLGAAGCGPTCTRSLPGSAQLHSGATGALLHRWEGTAEQEDLGYSVSLGPDVDGDGLADVLLGAHGTDGGGPVRLHSGADGRLLSAVEGQVGTLFGHAVSLGPDVDGDGRGELLVGAMRAAGVYLFSGTTGAWLKEWVPSNEMQIGIDVSLGPDADGDGAADALVGTYGGDTVWLVSGRRGEPLCAFPVTPPSRGRWVSLGPDLNGDGRADLLIGGGDTVELYVSGGS